MKRTRKLLGSLVVSCLFLAVLLPETVHAQATENAIVSRMADVGGLKMHYLNPVTARPFSCCTATPRHPSCGVP